jgi:hypothetical protein
VAEGSARFSVLGLELVGMAWHVTVASLETRSSGALRIVSVRTEQETDAPGPRALLQPSRAPRRKRRSSRRTGTAEKPRPGQNCSPQNPRKGRGPRSVT